MSGIWFCCVLAPLFSSGVVSAIGGELLINGDFEIGTPEDDKPASFVCKGWRRLLWKESEPNSWLTCGERDWQVGNGNQALEYRWGATSICQFFSARSGETYQFSIDYLNPGSHDSRWQPRIQVEWLDAHDKAIGPVSTVAEADYATAPVKKWNILNGSVKAPPNTAYGRVLLNVNNKGSGPRFLLGCRPQLFHVQRCLLPDHTAAGHGLDHERVIRSIQTPGDTPPGTVGRPMFYLFADNGNVSLVNRQTSTPYAFLHASRTCPTLKRRSSFPPARGSNEIQPSYPPFLRTLKTPRMSTSPLPITTPCLPFLSSLTCTCTTLSKTRLANSTVVSLGTFAVSRLTFRRTSSTSSRIFMKSAIFVPMTGSVERAHRQSPTRRHLSATVAAASSHSTRSSGSPRRKGLIRSLVAGGSPDRSREGPKVSRLRNSVRVVLASSRYTGDLRSASACRTDV